MPWRASVPAKAGAQGSERGRVKSWAPAFAGVLAVLVLSGCAGPRRPASVSSAAPALPPKTYQWLHGSGEAAVLQQQAYREMARFVLAQQAARGQGRAVEGAVLAPDGTPEAPRWVPCGAKPSAVVLDIDETSILNTGANYDSARRGDPPFDPTRWSAWEKDGTRFVEPLPGAPDALRAIRAAGVTPIFISNRSRSYADQASAALAISGLGRATHGQTLFLQGDVAPGSGKDPRRARVAATWCVLAMAGDQLGDFSDTFNDKALSVPARRQRAQAPGVAAKWGGGWFLMPNPVYGPGVAGSFDDLFPAGLRWPGPAPETK